MKTSVRRILKSNLIVLALAVVVGIGLGSVVPYSWMGAVLTLKQVSGQVIFFLVPLIILGFVAPSIAALGSNVSRTVTFAFVLAYTSSVCAALFASVVARLAIPLLHIGQAAEGGKALPELFLNLEIPPVMSVMTALALAALLGLGAVWAKADNVTELLRQFQGMVLAMVRRVLVPVLPVFIASNFCVITYMGYVGRLGVFFPVILIAVVCHFVWMALLYVLASVYSGQNGWGVLRHYGPAYLTALGTMSSAATLGVALECIRRGDLPDKRAADFAVPLFANIHLCGSVLTEALFVCVVSQMLYGALPGFDDLVVFILLLGIVAVGAPGVPGGTVTASLGLLVSVLGFDEAGTALLITVFALQDSFGTACNVTCDGALTLMVCRKAKGRD